MSGTKAILAGCGWTLTSKVLIDAYENDPYCSEMVKDTEVGEPRYSLNFQVVGDVELEKVARKIAEDIAQKVLTSFREEEKRLSHPKMQPNIKGFKK